MLTALGLALATASSAFASSKDIVVPDEAKKQSEQYEPGVTSSSYRGTFYDSGQESKRECIAQRESNGHYTSVSHSGTYRGAYQMSKALARGVTFMMADEHKEKLGVREAKQTLKKLRNTPVNKWPRYWQDAAFYTIYNWDGKASGARHWAGGRYHC